jgi:hypothetical protein
MFFENVGLDQLQVVNGLAEFRGHASRPNGHEANSGNGDRNLPRAIVGQDSEIPMADKGQRQTFTGGVR